MTPFHEGELRVQNKVGVEDAASRVGRGIHSLVPPVARDFLSRQPMVIIGSVGKEGVWCSLLSGEPGFLRALDERTLEVSALPPRQDPLLKNLRNNTNVGLLAIDFAQRKRMRINGKAEVLAGGLRIKVVQAYANCPKYIQSRSTVQRDAPSNAPHCSFSSMLTPEQTTGIATSDTFFISSYSVAGGADASHRGGQPGFVRVLDHATLEFPDYLGNNMFNTLGNIFTNPSVGLLFINFENGSTLQLSGEASIVWDECAASSIAEAQRVIRFKINSVVETTNATPLRWRFNEYSPFNPS